MCAGCARSSCRRMRRRARRCLSRGAAAGSCWRRWCWATARRSSRLRAEAGGGDMRDSLLDRLKCDLVGPYTADEVLTSRPSDVYLTGILWPRETRMGAEEDERLGLSGGEESETDGGGEEEEVSLAGLARPCSAGVSFAARTAQDSPELDVTVRFATYEPVVPDESDAEEQENGGGRARRRTEWRRRAHNIPMDGVTLNDASRFVDLEPHGAPPGVRLHIRTAPWSGG